MITANDIPVSGQAKLLGLPPPDLIATPEFEAIFLDLAAKFKALMPEHAYLLESHPITILLQVWAYERLFIDRQINAAARGTLLAFAKGDVLDFLGEERGVYRLVVKAAQPNASPPTLAVMESDERFRDRIQMGISLQSQRGGTQLYRFHAMSATTRVLDAIAFSPYTIGGEIVVCILSTENNGIATTELINIVKDYIYADGVKTLNDIVTVEGAVPKIVDVEAKIVLKRSTPMTVFDGMAAKIIAGFEQSQKLGADITTAWVGSLIYQQGVHAINFTTDDIKVGPNEFPVLGNLNLIFDGYSDQEAVNTEDVEKTRAIRFIHEQYRTYCIQQKRSKDQIVGDLLFNRRPGIFEPTVVSFAEYLNITEIRNASNVLLSEDEIAELIYKTLLPLYA